MLLAIKYHWIFDSDLRCILLCGKARLNHILKLPLNSPSNIVRCAPGRNSYVIFIRIISFATVGL